MAFEYTKTSLKTALQLWNTNADSEFVGALDEIIKRGEFRLERMLDLEQFDTAVAAETAAGTALVVKPANLVIDRLLMLASGAGWVPLPRRSRAWVEMYNVDGETGVPKYYADYDEANWFVAPIPSAILAITVHGLYRPVSLVDGADAGTTWLSTRVPDLLYLACSVEANEFLKFWAHKAANEVELADKAQKFLGIAAGMQRSDVEDIVGNRQNVNKPGTQAEA